MPEFVSKQKASSQTGIRIIHTLQIACQHHRPTEREREMGKNEGEEEDGGRRRGETGGG